MTLLDILLVVLLGMPFASGLSTLYLARLVKDAVAPPSLLVMLTASSFVTFMSSSYLAALNVNVRMLGHTNPPELAPLTVAIIIAPLAMINVIAFQLWRVSRSVHRGRLMRDVPDKARTLGGRDGDA